MQNTIPLKTRTSILSIIETFEFSKDLNLSMKNLNLEMLEEVFKKFNLLNHSETNDFLSMGRYVFKKYINKEENIKVISVLDRESRCAACNFGKNVTVYDVQYKKKHSGIAVIYSSSFAINLDVFKGELLEYAWCNAFLSKEEIDDITKF